MHPLAMQGYSRFHQNKTDLLLHIVMVPLFVGGVVYALSSAMQGRWLAAVPSSDRVVRFGRPRFHLYR